MEAVELSEMLAIAFLAGCGVLMSWPRTAQPALDRRSTSASPAAVVAAMFAGILVLELLLLYHR